MSDLTPNWSEEFGFDVHAAALLWLVDANAVSTEAIVACLLDGATRTDVPEAALDAFGTSHRATLLNALSELARGAPGNDVAELLLRWYRTCDWPVESLARSAYWTHQLVDEGHDAHSHLVCAEDVLEGYVALRSGASGPDAVRALVDEAIELLARGRIDSA